MFSFTVTLLYCLYIHTLLYDVCSAGQDCTLHQFSTDHDRHSKSMGRAVWNKKAEVKRLMPPFSQVGYI